MASAVRPPQPLISDPPRSGDSRRDPSRAYKCPLCDKAFNRLEHKGRHIRTHTGERPHACQQCSKRFSRSDELLRHSRVHDREHQRHIRTYQDAAATARRESSTLAIEMPSPNKTASLSPPTSKSSSPNVSPHSYTNYASTTPQGGLERSIHEGTDALNINLLAAVASQIDYSNTQLRPSRRLPSPQPSERGTLSTGALSQWSLSFVAPHRDHTYHGML